MKTTHEERENWRTVEDHSWAELSSTQLTNRILGVLVTVGVGMAVVMGILEQMTVGEFFSSLSTEIIGAAATFYALELVIRPRKLREDMAAQKEKTIQDMGSGVHDVAMKAVEAITKAGWLKDGSLQGTELSRANLDHAKLRAANLRGANFIGASLQQVNLEGANLQEANLVGANLQKSKLTVVDAQGAYLRTANLEGTDLVGGYLAKVNLEGANLESANLWFTNLESADLQNSSLRNVLNIESATFNEYTLLPNGDKWYEGYDLTLFTDPSHANFWEMDWTSIPELLQPEWYRNKVK